METTLALIAVILTVLGNCLAVGLAGYGVYRGAVKDYEHEREERKRLQELLDECHARVEALRQQLSAHEPARPSGITVSGGTVSIGHDAAGGDVAKHDDIAGRSVSVQKTKDP